MKCPNEILLLKMLILILPYNGYKIRSYSYCAWYASENDTNRPRYEIGTSVTTQPRLRPPIRNTGTISEHLQIIAVILYMQQRKTERKTL